MCSIKARLLSLVLGSAWVVLCFHSQESQAWWGSWFEEYRTCVEGAEGSGMTRLEARSYCSSLLPETASEMSGLDFRQEAAPLGESGGEEERLGKEPHTTDPGGDETAEF